MPNLSEELRRYNDFEEKSARVEHALSLRHFCLARISNFERISMKDEIKFLDLQLIDACCDLKYDEVLHLLDAGADPDAVDVKKGDSPLSALVRHSTHRDGRGNFSTSENFGKTAELLLERGADINLIIKTCDGHISTALFSALDELPGVVRFLLAHDADPDVINEEGETVLDVVEFWLWADHEGIPDYWVREAKIRKILLDHGAHRAQTLAMKRNAKRWDPVKRSIHTACWHLQAERLERILNENHIHLRQRAYADLFPEAIVTAQEFMQRYFPNDAAGYEKRLIATLEILLQHGCKNDNALYFAVENGYVETSRYLLAHGADPGKCDCGYWQDAQSELRHDVTLADEVFLWCGRWKKKTALAFREMFPRKSQERP